MGTDDRDPLTGQIICCAIEVHRQLGPGLLESTYLSALVIELELASLRYARQVRFPVIYKGRAIGACRVDLIVEGRAIVEVKSVSRWDPVFEAQILTYLRIAQIPVGLLLNFNCRMLRDGIKRFVI
jgi:GxxExxY protein